MDEPSVRKKWFIAFRPWSFTAAIVPVLLGTVWAWYTGYFHPLLFLLTLIGGIAIQAGTNLINTYYDYKSGVDSIDSVKNCPVLVAGWLNPEHVKKAGLYSFATAFTIGMYLVFLRGWPILALGLIGIAGGYGYTGSLAYKYKGLGSTLVFFLMGPLMVWGAFYVQTGFHSWSAVLISLPIGFLVSGILHCNDLRDINHDRQAGIQTLALAIGTHRGLALHFFLYTGAFISVLCFVITGFLPPWVLISILLALPAGIKIIRNGKQALQGNQLKLETLEMEAAQFHFQFGLLFTLGVFTGGIL